MLTFYWFISHLQLMEKTLQKREELSNGQPWNIYGIKDMLEALVFLIFADPTWRTYWRLRKLDQR
jgi:hypothetical protein